MSSIYQQVLLQLAISSTVTVSVGSIMADHFKLSSAYQQVQL